MYNTNIPADRELPSTRKLLKTTALAIGAAGFLLVAIVLPAEYGIDPTGLGRLTGLERMGTIKMAHAREAEEERLAEEQFEIAMQQRPASSEDQQAAAQVVFGAGAPSDSAPTALPAVDAPVEAPAVAEPAPAPCRPPSTAIADGAGATVPVHP